MSNQSMTILSGPSIGRCFLACLCLGLVAAPASAEKVAWRDTDNRWQVMDAADWPQTPKTPKTEKTAKTFGPATTDIQFTVIYQDVVQDTNIGFDDPDFGAERRATVDAVLEYIDSVLNESGRADIEWHLSETDGQGFVASAGSFYSLANGFMDAFSHQHITTGSDPNGSVPDIQGTVDFGKNLNVGTALPGPAQIDLFTVLLHEITHGLGFASLAASDGTSAISGTNPGTFTVFDDLVYTGGGKDLWTSGGTFSGVPSDLTGGDNGLFFRGTMATSVLGIFPALHAPGTYAPGSSVGHWSQAEFGGVTVMPPLIAAGSTYRQYADFELGALHDLGYTNVVVPQGGDVFNNERSDINQDGVVDAADVLILQSDWNKTRP